MSKGRSLVAVCRRGILPGEILVEPHGWTLASAYLDMLIREHRRREQNLLLYHSETGVRSH